MIKAEWTNKDSLDLQPTCNQLATDLISRQHITAKGTQFSVQEQTSVESAILQHVGTANGCTSYCGEGGEE